MLFYRLILKVLWLRMCLIAEKRMYQIFMKAIHFTPPATPASLNTIKTSLLVLAPISEVARQPSVW